MRSTEPKQDRTFPPEPQGHLWVNRAFYFFYSQRPLQPASSALRAGEAAASGYQDRLFPSLGLQAPPSSWGVGSHHSQP